MPDTTVAVIGGGVVGAAVLFTLAHRGIAATLLEADTGLAYGASGTNSGVLHTGFDAKPGELETALMLRAARLRDPVLHALDVPVLRCGAELTPFTDAERATVAGLAHYPEVKGRFNFVSDRETDFHLGTGTLTIQDGRAIAKSSAGTGILTFHDQAGNPVLVVEVALKDNNHYFLEMTPFR